MDLSIVITTYNYEKYLEDCIRSCIHQENHSCNYEILIVDDGSTDKTDVILDSYSNINNIKKYHIKNSGIEKASNFGFKKSSGKYIVRVDADDALLPNYISSIERDIFKEKDFIFTNYSTINTNGKILKNNSNLPEFDKKEIHARGDFLATGTAYKKEIIETYKGYNTDKINSGLENYEFVLQLISKGYEGSLVEDIAFLYRRHNLNISEIKKDAIIMNGKNLFKKLGLGRFKTNKNHPYGLKV